MKKKKTHYLLKSLVFYKKHIKLTIAVAILSILYAVLSLLPPILEGKILASFTEILKDFPYAKILIMAGVLVVLIIIINIITNIWSDTVLKLNERVNFDIKHKLFKNLTKIKTHHFNNEQSGSFISRLDKDCYAVAESYDFITDCLSCILLNVSFIIYILVLNIWVGLYTILTILILYIIDIFAVREFKKFGEIQSKNKDKIISIYNEGVKGIRDIKNFNVAEEFSKETDIHASNYLKSASKYTHIRRTWNRVRDSVKAVLTFGLFALTLLLIKNKMILVETFLIVYVYKSNINEFIRAVSDLRYYIANGNVSAKRLFDILEYNKYEKEVFGDQPLDPSEGIEIEFKDVSFSYEDNCKLFENLNILFEKNKITAIVGKSGQGKSSIINLINKTYEKQAGNIIINGKDIEEYSEDALRDNISIVSQSPYIFNLSIKENLSLIKPDSTFEEIQEACKKAQIHDFIISLPEGYETKLSEDGVNLSGGQKQRIAIARALLKKSNVILFDEATSSLDNESQEKIKDVIFNLRNENHTIIMVAHRLSTIKDADVIYVIDNKKIIGKGTHKELIKKNKKYKELYNSTE
ncbi:MAG: ABC transporter ATP-binding protein [Clostridia bacterium]|nr:ABC transporter ATP-binding protein [Clostridia bacterium]